MKKHEPEINQALDRWTETMRAKLIENRHKGGWRNCSVSALLRRVHEELGELVEAVMNDEAMEHIDAEAADVANMAMMVADVFRCDESRPWEYPPDGHCNGGDPGR